MTSASSVPPSRRLTAAGPFRALACGLLVFALFLPRVARAHDPGISTAQGRVHDGVLDLTVGFAPSDAQQLLPPSARSERRWTETEFNSAHPALDALAPHLWELRAGERIVLPQSVRVELAAGDALNFHFVYPLPDAPTLTLRALKIGELPSGHREFVIITDEHGSTIAKKLVSAKDTALVVPLTPSSGDGGPEANRVPSGMPTFWGFIRLGIEHIWTGYDHLLFLFALLVVCRSFRSIAAIVSCFTVAHSLTLGLATMNIVNLPSRVVEPAIAASIVFVGAENLWRRGAEPRGRWALTFAFGLIHGFGFASVLRELGIGRGGQGLAVPLFTFNAGVEIGQIAIAAIVLPVVWQLRKREGFVRWGVPVLSLVVTLAGLYWFLERTVWA